MDFPRMGQQKLEAKFPSRFRFFANPESIKWDDFSPVPAHLFLFGGGDIGV
jgi:hypothetical protein